MEKIDKELISKMFRGLIAIGHYFYNVHGKLKYMVNQKNYDILEKLGASKEQLGSCYLSSDFKSVNQDINIDVKDIQEPPSCTMESLQKIVKRIGVNG